jgi:segregation and condensation protein B
MNQKQIKAAVEAMLFAAGDPVSADKLAAAVQLPQTTVETALEDLRVRYAREDSGLCLLHLDTRWQLATRTEWADCIRRLLDARRSVPLGPAAMETLTVIAYNQPVSRAFIEQVRGVDSLCSHHAEIQYLYLIHNVYNVIILPFHSCKKKREPFTALFHIDFLIHLSYSTVCQPMSLNFFPKMGQSQVLHQMPSQLLSFDHILLQIPMQIHSSKHLSE